MAPSEKCNVHHYFLIVRWVHVENLTGGRRRSFENIPLQLDSTQKDLSECVSYMRDCMVCCQVRLIRA